MDLNHTALRVDGVEECALDPLEQFSVWCRAELSASSVLLAQPMRLAVSFQVLVYNFLTMIYRK